MGQENETQPKSSSPERPVASVGYKMSDYYTLLGLATREMRVPGDENDADAIRSPLNRLERGIEYQRIRWQRLINKIPRHFGRSDWIDVKHSDRERMQQLDEFDRQFQDLNEIEIETEQSGYQPLTYSEVELKGTKDNKKEGGKDADGGDEVVTFIIPAWSGTIYGVEPLARALAENGGKVVTFNYPESLLSEPTDEFAKKMEESLKPNEPVNYNPHTAVFKEAIKTLAKGKKIRIVSYSTGGPITAEMLQDPEFSENVELAVLLSPASAVNQNKLALRGGTLAEFTSPAGVLSPSQDLAPLMFARDWVNTGIVTGPGKKVDPEVQARRQKISDILESKVCKKSDKFETARVSGTGKVIIQTGQFDAMTKADTAFRGKPNFWSNEGEGGNPQAVWLDCPDFSHTSPLMYARELVKNINQIVSDKTHRKKYTFSYS